MIRDFDNWNNNIGEASSLDDLKGFTVGIEAADYLQTRILRYPRALEPLVPALGGLPLSLELHVKADIERFAEANIQPFFVFSGLEIAKPENPFRLREEGAAVNAEAWQLYDLPQAQESVDKFAESRKECSFESPCLSDCF
jgi:hypothetical protein